MGLTPERLETPIEQAYAPRIEPGADLSRP
jgi:hypothetical protein